MRIFIVDDDRDFAESLADVMELHGHNVDLAYSGEEAVSGFQHKQFDLTFMDVRLPGKNGVESFLEIRKINPQAKVIMMTGYSVEQLLDQAVEHGAWGVIHKPLEMPRIMEMIDQIKPDGILIADDDPDFRDAIKEILEHHGYVVMVASNGQEAIAHIEQDDIDVLILDLRMPIMTGLGVYQTLKQKGLSIPTILVTAYAREERETLDVMKKWSITGILTKPFDPGDLISIIDNVRGRQKT
jgi:CheY-like chemotaxis protein